MMMLPQKKKPVLEDGPGSPNYLGGQQAAVLPKPVSPGPGVAMLPGGIQPMSPGMMPQGPTPMPMNPAGMTGVGSRNEYSPGMNPNTPGMPNDGRQTMADNGMGLPGTNPGQGGGAGTPGYKPGGPNIGPGMPSATPTRDTTAMSTFGPGNDLRDNQIAPGMEVDRYQMGLDRFNQYAEATDPQYQKTIRDATKAGAAHGLMGSGMLTTDYGNLAGDRLREMDLSKRGFLSDALEGTINDGRSNREELRGERDYQTGTAERAQAAKERQRLMEEALLNSQFNRDQRITETLGGYGGF